MNFSRRDALKGAAALAALSATGGSALAQAKFFRIGTGGTGGTYYPIGGIIANAISSDKVNASAVASNGSVANVNAIVGGASESGFSQADVATWAYTGTGIYEGKGKIEELRAIANLYPETVHIVVKKGLGVKSPADIKGKRFSVDEPGSGSAVVDVREDLNVRVSGSGSVRYLTQPKDISTSISGSGSVRRRDPT